jgi:hypothetical protein
VPLTGPDGTPLLLEDLPDLGRAQRLVADLTAGLARD